MLFMPCQLEPIITSYTLTTGHFTKYKSSPDMYNGIIFISIKWAWITYKVNIVIWGGLVIRGPRYELHLTSFWKCLACADFIKDLIWRVQLLNGNVFFFLQFMENIIVYPIWHSCQLEPIITSFTLTTGHFTKYKSSPDMYNGIIFISIKCGFFGVFFNKTSLTSSKRKTCNYRFQLTGHE
jgi:hypothetical protein